VCVDSIGVSSILFLVVYYETKKREIIIKPISECRCDERLKPRNLRASQTLGCFSRGFLFCNSCSLVNQRIMGTQKHKQY
jgi:hypothetical protein